MEIAFFETMLVKFFELFAGKMPVWQGMIFLIIVFLIFSKNKFLGRIYTNIVLRFNQKNKIQEKIARHLTKTSSTLEKFSNNVNQNTQMLKENFDRGFAEILLKIDELPSKEFFKTETEEVKKKIAEMHLKLNEFIENSTKK